MQMIERLRRENVRLTRQREIICAMFADHPDQHFTADALWRAFYPEDAVGLATIYRTLSVFEDVGLIKRIDIGDGIARYELADEQAMPHCHLICMTCGRVQEIDGSGMEAALKNVRTREFVVRDQTIVFHGYCSECRENERETKARGKGEIEGGGQDAKG